MLVDGPVAYPDVFQPSTFGIPISGLALPLPGTGQRLLTITYDATTGGSPTSDLNEVCAYARPRQSGDSSGARFIGSQCWAPQSLHSPASWLTHFERAGTLLIDRTSTGGGGGALEVRIDGELVT